MPKGMTVVRCNVIGKSRLWSPTKLWLLKWSKRLSNGMIRFPGAGIFVGAIGSILSSGNPYIALAICIMYMSIWSIAL